MTLITGRQTCLAHINPDLQNWTKPTKRDALSLPLRSTRNHQGIPPNSPQAAPKLAFTLLEVLLVLSLVLMMASLVTPNLFRFYQRTAATRQAMQVQVVLGQARTRAIEHLETQIFQYEPGGTRYRIIANGEKGTAHTSRQTEALSSQFSPTNSNSFHILSSGCSFQRAESRYRKEKMLQILFFSDGTATAHDMGIKSELDETHWINIDPLTAASRRQRGERRER